MNQCDNWGETVNFRHGSVDTSGGSFHSIQDYKNDYITYYCTNEPC